MEKTVREWLMELKPEHRDLAIKNMDDKDLERVEKDLSEALFNAFQWYKSNEGHNFWETIWYELRINTYYDEEAKS